MSSSSAAADGEHFDLSVGARNVGSPQDGSTLPTETGGMLVPNTSEGLEQKRGGGPVPKAKTSGDLSGSREVPEEEEHTSSPTKHVQDVATLRLADGSFSKSATNSAVELAVLNSSVRRYSAQLPPHHGNSLDRPGSPRRFSDLPAISKNLPNHSSSHRHGHSRASTASMPHKDLVISPLGLSHRISSPTHRQGEGLRRLSQVLASNHISGSSGRDSDQPGGKNPESSWEVLSRLSSTSHRLSIRQDQSNPCSKLVPLWECLQVRCLPHLLPLRWCTSGMSPEFELE